MKPDPTGPDGPFRPAAVALLAVSTLEPGSLRTGKT
jgi:hypothetical protein